MLNTYKMHIYGNNLKTALELKQASSQGKALSDAVAFE